MLNFLEIGLPLILLVIIILPLIKVFRGHVTVKQAKSRLTTHIVGFFSIIALVFVVQLFVRPTVYGATALAVDPLAGTIAQGLGFLGAAMATGLSSLGAGIAVGGAAPAAIGAFSEDEKNFGKSLIFVALGEGVAIYGLLMSILILNKL